MAEILGGGGANGVRSTQLNVVRREIVGDTARWSAVVDFSSIVYSLRFDDITQGLAAAGVIKEDLLLVESREFGPSIRDVKGGSHDGSWSVVEA